MRDRIPHRPTGLRPRLGEERALLGGSRGAVMVEYALLLVAFAVPVVGATGWLGAELVKGYVATRDNVLQEGP